ncbi:MAG: helix-turn-helix domain-containing protein [Deltaproteobacteria bacterium]|nr:helix-turn-helix domain-containing protein [Deltaproteobacteria bacterium]
MSKEAAPLKNNVKRFREERGWSQQDLAERSGLSRAGVSAIEVGKLVPSTVAALSLAKVFGCRVEELFQLGGDEEIHWAWPPAQESCRYWRAVVHGRMILLPVEVTPLGMVPHDGMYRDDRLHDNASFDPNRTLVLACCDPAVGLLASEYNRTTPFRMLVLSRPSRQALHLLRDGVVHTAGLHLAESCSPGMNGTVAKEILSAPFRLLRVTNWQAGLATTHGLGNDSLARVLSPDVRWIGREPGSGARQVQDELLQGVAAPAIEAKNHAEVVDAIRSGWAEAGVSIRLVAEEAGLDFIAVREEAYDLCILRSQEDDPRLRALVEVVRSLSLRSMLRELPGYDVGDTGEMI